MTNTKMMLKRNHLSYQLPVVLVLWFVAALVYLSSGTDGGGVALERSLIETTLAGEEEPTPITLGETSHGVTYYHCSSASDSASASDAEEREEGDEEDVVTLVLLHGAKFSKETWKNENILQDFCMRTTVNRKLDVYAVDLNNNDYHDLIEFLDDMEQSTEEEHQLTKPVSLVTPSASGRTIVSWVQQSTDLEVATELPNYIDQWIPVAAAGTDIVKATDIGKLKDLPVLAIYGDLDKKGKTKSERLDTLLEDVTVVEMAGHHPCYLDSPKEFVTTVVEFIDVSDGTTS